MPLPSLFVVRILFVVIFVVAQWNPSKATDVNFGFLADFSGPIASIAPVLSDGMQLAFSHVNNQGGLHGGKNAVQVKANSRCSSKSRAISAAEQLIGNESAVAIVGGICSGTTLAAAQGFTIPTGTPMISPASLSPAISGLLDNDLLYRTISADNGRTNALVFLIEEEALEQLSIVHTSKPETLNQLERLKTLLDGERPFEIVTHELGNDEDSAIENALEWQIRNGGDLIILDDLDSNPNMLSFLGQASGLPSVRHIYIEHEVDKEVILQTVSLPDQDKVTLITGAGSSGSGFPAFSRLASVAGLDPDFPFLTNTYDAAFILALAVELNHVDRSIEISSAIRSVTNPPGEIILPGEWGKAIELISAGKEIDYEGASGTMEFDENGDLVPSYAKATLVNGEFHIQESLN